MKSNARSAKKKANSSPATTTDSTGASSSGYFPVAAIGASAGGIEAFSELMRGLPPDTGMAFVLIQHLDPRHHSILTDLIARETAMPVKEVTDKLRLEPNHIYVIPPNTTMHMTDNTLHLNPRNDNRAAHMPIDNFMRSLAEDRRDRAVGVILSGTGSDGTLGLAEIQAQGGVTIAQEVKTAKYDGMPHSAIAAGYVDYVLAPGSIGPELARIAGHPYVAKRPPAALPAIVPSESAMTAIFQLLRRDTGVDFTHYRQTTILRRIQRRMVVHKLDRIQDYLTYIQSTPSEIKSLYQDLLINVTSFFRDPGLFETLQTLVFPAIFKNRPPGKPVRIWTPACASGEETYSLAISLLEYLHEKAPETAIQFFGTDISDTSIARARAGLYPENIEGDVSPERLRRSFTKTDGGYRINKSIRDMCIFAEHNVLNDPPFSQMDIICCRNLMIYLEPVLQNKMISLFHYAIRAYGFLILGASEGSGNLGNLFTIEDRTHKIFLKKTSGGRQVVTFSLNRQADRLEPGSVQVPDRQQDANWNYLEAQREFDRRLLSQHAPAAAFVNSEMEIVHNRGNISRYLKLAPGRASLSILKMVREGMLFDLRNAINKAKKENVPVSRENIEIKTGNGSRGSGPNGGSILVNFNVTPFLVGNTKDLYFMILFEDAPELKQARLPKRSRGAQEAQRDANRILKLEQDLAATKEYLQSVIESQEATNEELQSANEEILSSNEELQSTNEELDTAKEELQSSNEELNTVNDELRSRNVQLTNDLTHLFANIDISIMMVGSDLTIRRFTPHSAKVMGLIAADVGRPLSNINLTIEIPDFQQTVLQVIESGRPFKNEFQGRDGKRYQLRVLPSQSADSKNDGAVITLLDISPR